MLITSNVNIVICGASVSTKEGPNFEGCKTLSPDHSQKLSNAIPAIPTRKAPSYALVFDKFRNTNCEAIQWCIEELSRISPCSVPNIPIARRSIYSRACLAA